MVTLLICWGADGCWDILAIVEIWLRTDRGSAIYKENDANKANANNNKEANKADNNNNNKANKADDNDANKANKADNNTNNQGGV